MESYFNSEGPADINIAGIAIWGIRREYPDENHSWDYEWINILAQIEVPNALIRLEGPYLRLRNLDKFTDKLETVYREVSGEADLDGQEPGLTLKISCNHRGSVAITIELMPDYPNQLHRIESTSDQTCIPNLIRECRDFIGKFSARA